MSNNDDNNGSKEIKDLLKKVKEVEGKVNPDDLNSKKRFEKNIERKNIIIDIFSLGFPMLVLIGILLCFLFFALYYILSTMFGG